MDNAYRFGRVEVSCEGFSHPDDPYILKGSCGLEYTLELAGRQGGHGSRGSGAFGDFAGFASSLFGDAYDGRRQQQAGGGFHQSSSGGDMGGLIVVGLLLLIAYGVYKMFLCGPTHNQDRFPDDAGYPSGTSQMGPPPAGFKADYSGTWSCNLFYFFIFSSFGHLEMKLRVFCSMHTSTYLCPNMPVLCHLPLPMTSSITQNRKYGCILAETKPIQ